MCVLGGGAQVHSKEKTKKEEKYVSKTPTNTLAQKDGNTKPHNSLVYIRQHWQLYAFFIMPAFVLTIIFRYIPMGGIAIAFTDYNPSVEVFVNGGAQTMTATMYTDQAADGFPFFATGKISMDIEECDLDMGNTD